MKWYFVDTGLNDGNFNMQYDIELTKKISSSECILRFYQWNPYCISLGANQNFSEINIIKAKNDNIDVVKRPTGGRAILHSEELTYSIVFPLSLNYSVRDIYNQINLALKKGLEIFNPELKKIELENNQIDFRNFYKKDISSICFAVSARYEINYLRKKLVGSAQRKIGNLVLQHGSILCGTYHQKLVNYLNIEQSSLEKISNELNNTTIDLKTILGKEINISDLSESIKKGFEKHFQISFQSLSK
jgi:lipoate-protein ligase A